MTGLLSPPGDSSLSQSIKEVSPQLLLPPQRPTTLPACPRRSVSIAPALQRPAPGSPRSPQQETSTVTTSRKLSSTSSTTSTSTLALRSYMNPTASSMAKMFRSVSVGDGLHLSEPPEDPSSQVDTPPHAAVVPIVVTSSSPSLDHHGNQAAPPCRGLQARVPGSSRPLPDKPSLASFSPSSSSSTSRPPPVSVPPLVPLQQDKDPQTPADQRGDTGLDPPLLHPYILHSPLFFCFVSSLLLLCSLHLWDILQLTD